MLTLYIRLSFIWLHSLQFFLGGGHKINYFHLKYLAAPWTLPLGATALPSPLPDQTTISDRFTYKTITSHKACKIALSHRYLGKTLKI
jgi:hypothetical protein